jgi:hypothetical protein
LRNQRLSGTQLPSQNTQGWPAPTQLDQFDQFLAPGNNVVHFEYASQDNILDAFQAHTTNLVGSVKQGLFAFKSTATFKDANTEKEMMVQFV